MSSSNSIIVYGINPTNERKLDVTSRTRKTYGLTFPVGRRSGAGDYNRESGVSLLRNNIEQLLQTEKGERVMIPQYGMSLKRFLFEPLTEELFVRIRHEVLTSIATYATEVKVMKIQVIESDDINVEGGMGLIINLSLVAKNLNNTIFQVGVRVV